MNTPRLIVINQVVTDGFVEWLKAFAEIHGPVELWTGSRLELETPAVKIRQFPAYDRSSNTSRLLAWMSFSLAALWRLLRSPRRIPALAFTNPPFLPLIIVIFHLLQGRHYGLIEYDIYPQIMVPMGLLSERNPVYGIWRRWHALSLRRARLVVTLSHLMAEELRGMVSVPLPHLTVIPTWTDTRWIKPMDRGDNPFIVQNGLQNQTVILYSGNLGTTHSIETIIEVAERLKHESGLRFVMIGAGAKREVVEKAIRDGKTPNVLLLPLQPWAMLPFSLSSGDMAFVTLAPGYERLSLPSKTYDMMAAGNAIIGISDVPGGLDDLLKKFGCGRNFPPAAVEEIASWIVALAGDQERLSSLQHAARDAAVRDFSAEACGERLQAAIETYLMTGADHEIA